MTTLPISAEVIESLMLSGGLKVCHKMLLSVFREALEKCASRDRPNQVPVEPGAVGGNCAQSAEFCLSTSLLTHRRYTAESSCIPIGLARKIVATLHVGNPKNAQDSCASGCLQWGEGIQVHLVHIGFTCFKNSTVYSTSSSVSLGKPAMISSEL